MDKTQESLAQLFILIRSQGALLSAVVKSLINKGHVDRTEIKEFEQEIMRRLERISKLAVENKDVKEQLQMLEEYISNAS